MREFITLILLFALILYPYTGCFADGTSIVYNILDKPYEDTNSDDLIYNIIGKEKAKVKVKLINENTISNELESENNQGDQNAYIKGLDISKWNGPIDWKAIKKSGIKFVIIRAGYGTHVDYMFEKNIEEAIENNMIIGIYWFGYAYNDDMAVTEAKKCIKIIKKYEKHISLPIFYDYEYDSVNYAAKMGVRVNKKMVSSYADNFCSVIKKEGYNTGIYTNIDYANRYFTRDVLSKYHTWIAQWTNKCYYKYEYIIWQCTDSYYIGHKKFDLNYFYYNRFRGDK